MTMWIRNCALLASALTLAPFAAGQQARDYDKRSSMQLAALPNQLQLDALAALRHELDGSLAESMDQASGVTRSLFNPVGKLTPSNPGEPVDIALAYARDNVALLGLVESDLNEIQVCDSVYSAVSGATHVYLCQQHQGVDVFNAQLHVNVSRDGSILSVNNSFVPEIESASKSDVAAVSEEDACLAVADHLGISVRRTRRRGGRIVASDLSTRPIEAELIWMPIGRSLQLAWRFEVHTPDGEHVYDMTVDAEDGTNHRSGTRVMTRIDRVSPGLYEVFPVPVESPSHAADPTAADGRSVVVNPENPTASPNGWHDDGTPRQIMRGNNVHAYEDSDANDQPPANEPDCGPNLDCSFPLDLTLDPSTYRDAAVANLFYWTNVVHDVQYLYGFDEAAGNFQVDNFGLGGLGNDAVRAEAQDGSGFDNANFTTSVDGDPPKIQMFLWDLTSPFRDGDFDAGIVVHEYGHGISTRLVGGPSTVSCLSNFQQPGEGLSDWWSLVYTARPEDTGPDPRGIGTYVLGELPGPFGIRTQPYSTDPFANTHTYQSISGMAIPHGVGEVWAQAAWEAYWMLVNIHGFDANLYDPLGGAGNQRMMLYVNEGLKNTACSPTFTDVRDGIIQAAIDNYGGQDVCFLWEAFANFGLGEDAVSGGPWSTTPTNGFQVPSSCLSGPRITSPASLSVLPGQSATFEWTADGEPVDQWELDIGTSLGGDEIDSRVYDGSITTDVIDTLPVNGSQVFARLNYLIGTEWGFRDAIYTADLATPEITSPLPGSTLSGTAVTFTWDAMGLEVDNWILDIGVFPGDTTYFTSDVLAADALSIPAVGIPTNGSNVYVRLQYLTEGEWKSIDATYTAIDILPVFVAPTPGATLAGSTVTFSWSADGGLVDNWKLHVGSSVGASDLFNSNDLDSDETSIEVTGIPTDARDVYVRLHYAFASVWTFIDFTFTAADLSPEMISPVAGSTLPGSSAAFEWTSNGAPVQTWVLEVGSNPGLSNYFYSDSLDDNVTSVVATGIPTNGSAVHVRLRYLLAGGWTNLDFEYVAIDLKPELTSPVPGSILPSSTATFEWTANGASVSNWTLIVGTQPGLSNIHFSGTLAAGVTTADVTGLPLDNSTVYVQLRYLSGSWSTLDYTLTATGPAPAMTSPAPSSELDGPSVLFQWDDNGNNPSSWRLTIGNSFGGFDVYDATLAAGDRSHAVDDLPLDGRELFVRLYYTIGSLTSFADFAYTAALREPDMTNPTPGSILSGDETTFLWSANETAVTEWRLRVGTGVGGAEYFDSLPIGPNELTRTVSGFPGDGSTVYVRLEYTIDATSDFKDYVYTSGQGVPELVGPTPGSLFTGPDVTFEWTANDRPVVWWLLYVGTSPGSTNLHYSGYLQPSVTSRLVTGLPTDSRTIHVRLRYLLDGQWQSLDYQYTAADIVPELSTPQPSSVLTGSTVDFTWTSNGSAVTYWMLYVGSSVGGANYHYSGTLGSAVTSRQVTGLPTDSRTLYVRLRYVVNGSWQHTDYQYTAADLTPELTLPAPGSTFTGPDVTFQWTSNGAPVTRWILDVGTAPGLSNLHYSGTLTSGVLSRTVNNLPIDGATIHVRLRWVVNGQWKNAMYEYTAAGGGP